MKCFFFLVWETCCKGKTEKVKVKNEKLLLVNDAVRQSQNMFVVLGS